MKRCAGANRALDMDLARVLLDDAVGDRKAKPGTAPVTRTRHGFCGEKWIVNPLQMLRRNAGTRVAHQRLDMAVGQRCYLEVAAARSALGRERLGAEESDEWKGWKL